MLQYVISTDKKLLQIIIPEIKNDNNASINSCRVESDTSVDLGTNGRQPSPRTGIKDRTRGQSKCCLPVSNVWEKFWSQVYIVVYCHFLLKTYTKKQKLVYRKITYEFPHIHTISNLVPVYISSNHLFLTVLPCLMWTAT